MRLIYLLICLCLISCSSYKSYQSSKKECYQNLSFLEFNSKEKTLSNKIYDSLLIDNRIDSKNNTYNIKYYLANNYITYKKEKKNIQRLIKYSIDRKILYIRYKYLNGNTYIGKETYFDKQGNITKVIDHEKGYKICWAEAIAIMKKRYRSLIRKYEIHTFNLSRVSLNDFPEAKPRWTITMEGNEAYEQKGYDEGNKHYSFDGVTGKYLYTSTSISVYD